MALVRNVESPCCSGMYVSMNPACDTEWVRALPLDISWSSLWQTDGSEVVSFEPLLDVWSRNPELDDNLR
jgi:hypothetical protein